MDAVGDTIIDTRHGFDPCFPRNIGTGLALTEHIAPDLWRASHLFINDHWWNIVRANGFTDLTGSNRRRHDTKAAGKRRKHLRRKGMAARQGH